MMLRTFRSSGTRPPSEVGRMLFLSLAAVFGPVIAVDLLANIAGWIGR
jgi:hypothetical protein